MRSLILLGLLSGCATSAAGIGKTDVEMTFQSQKTAQVFANCAAETMIGAPDVRTDGTNYWVIRKNGYGVPVTRWDFKPAPGGGSIAELRSTISVNTGDERVKNCV